MRSDKRRERVRAFHVSSELDVLPAFTVAHGAVRNSLEEMRAFLHHPEESVRVQNPPVLWLLADDFQIKTVELLPHLRAALFATLPEIFARRRDARDDGRRMFAAEHQFVH